MHVPIRRAFVRRQEAGGWRLERMMAGLSRFKPISPCNALKYRYLSEKSRKSIEAALTALDPQVFGRAAFAAPEASWLTG
jgi:hypothetical protein